MNLVKALHCCCRAADYRLSCGRGTQFIGENHTLKECIQVIYAAGE